MLWMSAPQRSWRIIWIPVFTGMTKKGAGMTEGRRIEDINDLCPQCGGRTGSDGSAGVWGVGADV